MTKTVFIIAGPTAVGKTKAAIELAKQYDTEIISADSRQCYRELNIGVARPSPSELSEVPHHFIASHSIHEKVTADTFEEYALEKTSQLFKTKDAVVMVGGTGLYLKAFCDGLDEIPEVPASLREEIISEYNVKGLPWLQDQVEKYDPAFFKVGEIKNPHRLMRALEVMRGTGRSLLDYRMGIKKQRPFIIKKIALRLPKEKLHGNINNRVVEMVRHGLVEEVRSLIPYQHLPALQTVGYKELFEHFNGEATLEEAIESIKKNTRQYAKRQMTWFRKDAEYEWRENFA